MKSRSRSLLSVPACVDNGPVRVENWPEVTTGSSGTVICSMGQLRYSKRVESVPGLGFGAMGDGRWAMATMQQIRYHSVMPCSQTPVSYTHLRAHETGRNLV